MQAFRGHSTSGVTCSCTPQVETASSMAEIADLIEEAHAGGQWPLISVHVPADIQGLAYVVIHQEVL